MVRLKAFLYDVSKVLLRYYGPFILAIISTVSLFIFTGSELSGSNDKHADLFVKAALVSMLGIALLFALHFAKERFQMKWPIELPGLLVPVAYFFWIYSWDIDSFDPIITISLVLSVLCFHLLVSFLPFLKNNEGDGMFWEYNKILFLNTIQTVFFTFALWGGLALAVLAIEHLFNIYIADVFWARLAITVLIMGSTIIFSLFAKDGIFDLSSHKPYPVVLKFFVQYILIPLLIIYLLILYSYGIKILIEWNLPKGWVSYLVLVYASLGILSLLFLYPMYENREEAKSWVQFFLRIFYISLLPLLILLFVAIGFRILEYGYTENRYFVLILAIWLSVMALFQWFYKGNNIRIFPISLFAVAIACLLMPFLNVFAVSYTSQERELRRVLAADKLLTADGVIDFSLEIRRTTLENAADKIYYLTSRHQDNRIKDLLPHDSLLNNRYDFVKLFSNVIEDDFQYNQNNYFRFLSKKPLKEGVYDTKDYDYLLVSQYLPIDEYNQPKVFYFTRDSLELSFPSDFQVILKDPLRDTTYAHSYYQFVDSLYHQIKENPTVISPHEADHLFTEFTLGDFQFVLQFDEVNFSQIHVAEEKSGQEYRFWGWVNIFIRENNP